MLAKCVEQVDYKTEADALRTELELLRAEMGELKQRYEDVEAENKKLHVLANTDFLTKIYNRGAFDKKLAEEVYLAQRYGEHHTFSLLMIDIDHFKRINDTYGHPVGDKVLKAFAAIIAKENRKTDFFARVGGEEFSLILPLADAQEAYTKAVRIQVLSERIHVSVLSAGTVPVSVSIGIATCHPDDTFESIQSRVDEALYKAKMDGRNRIVRA